MAEGGGGSPDIGENKPQPTPVGDKMTTRRAIIEAAAAGTLLTTAVSLFGTWFLNRDSGKRAPRPPETGAPPEMATPTESILRENEIGGEKVRDLSATFVTDVPNAASNYKPDERPERSHAALYKVDNHAAVVLTLNVQDILQFIEQPEAVGLLINCTQDEQTMEFSLQKYLVRKLLNEENQGKQQKDHTLTIVLTDDKNKQFNNVFSADNTKLDPTFPKGTTLVSVSPERQGAAKSNPNLPDRIEFSDKKN